MNQNPGQTEPSRAPRRILLGIAGALTLFGIAECAVHFLPEKLKPEQETVYATELSETAPAQTEQAKTTVTTAKAEPEETATTTTTDQWKYNDIPAEFRAVNLSPKARTDCDYVDWWFSEWEDCYYLFLPATCDRAHLTIECSEGIELDGTPVVSGEETGLLSYSDDFDITVNGEEWGVLHVMQSELPVVYMTPQISGKDKKTGEPVSGFGYLDQHKSASCPADTVMLNANGTVMFSGTVAEISAHGNSSWDYSPENKKPYNVKFDSKIDLYGMGKAKKWVFLANYTDHSQIRDTVTDFLARQLGIEFVLDSTYVDMYSDGVYKGTYQIYERVQVQKQRVNITDLESATEKLNEKDLDEYPQVFLDADGNETGKDYNPGVYRYYDIPNNPEDITGGYLIQFQLYNRYKSKTKSGFVTSRGQTVQIDGPKYASRAQVEYIRQFIQEFEDALYASDGYNSLGKHYSEYCDIDSLARGYLIQELTMNPDGLFTSFYMWKESDLHGDGKLHYGPAWDFDLAYRNYSRANYNSEGDPHYSARVRNMYAAYFAISGYDSTGESGRTTEGVGWFMRLYQFDDFRQRAEEIYFDKLDGFLQDFTADDGTGYTPCEQYSQKILKSGRMNLKRWNMWGKNKMHASLPTGNTFEEHAEYVNNFLSDRREFLSETWLEDMQSLLTKKLNKALSQAHPERFDTAERKQLEKLIKTARADIAAAESVPQAQEICETAIAEMQKLPYAELSGDFDNNLAVDMKDAMQVLVYAAKVLAEIDAPLTPTQARNGDVDKNGAVNVLDAMHILRHADAETVGDEYPLPVS